MPIVQREGTEMAEGDGRSEAGDTEQVLWRIMGGGVFFGVGNEGGISAGKVTARKKGVGLATQPFKGLYLLLDRYLRIPITILPLILTFFLLFICKFSFTSNAYFENITQVFTLYYYLMFTTCNSCHLTFNFNELDVKQLKILTIASSVILCYLNVVENLRRMI